MFLKKMIVLVFLMTGFSFLPLAYAEENGPSDKGERIEKNIQEIFSQLNLTPEQKKLLDENKANDRGKRKEQFEKMRSTREALNKELMKPQLDMAKINAIHDQFKALQSQIADNHLNSILQVRKILSAEQYAKFSQLMEKSHHEGKEKEDKKW